MSQLAQAIINVINEVDNVEKNLTVGGTGNSYKGVSDKDVKLGLRRIMAKHGLVILPIRVKSKVTLNTWDETTQYGNAAPVTKRKKEVFTSVETKYKLLHTSGESEILEGSGQGVDTQDKSIGKATTYALKYALLYLFLVPVGEIDDSDRTHSDETPAPPAEAKKTKQLPEKKQTLNPPELKPVEPPKEPDPVLTLVPMSQKAFDSSLVRINGGEKLLTKIKTIYQLTPDQEKALNEAENKKPEGTSGLMPIDMGSFSAYMERIKSGEPNVINEASAAWRITESQLETMRKAIPVLNSKEEAEKLPMIKEKEFWDMMKEYKLGNGQAIIDARATYTFAKTREKAIKEVTDLFYNGEEPTTWG